MSNDHTVSPAIVTPQKPEKSEMQRIVNRVKSSLSITKVVSTRAVKTQKGDFFVGFSASWDSVQDDAGGMGSDLDVMVETEEVSKSGMTILEAQIAQQILNKEASVAAWRCALTEGAISEDFFEERLRQIKTNTSVHIGQIFKNHGG